MHNYMVYEFIKLDIVKHAEWIAKKTATVHERSWVHIFEKIICLMTTCTSPTAVQNIIKQTNFSTGTSVMSLLFSQNSVYASFIALPNSTI